MIILNSFVLIFIIFLFSLTFLWMNLIWIKVFLILNKKSVMPPVLCKCFSSSFLARHSCEPGPAAAVYNAKQFLISFLILVSKSLPFLLSMSLSYSLHIIDSLSAALRQYIILSCFSIFIFIASIICFS